MNEPVAATRTDGRYAWLVLFVLFVSYLFNVIDRQLLSILAEPIKAELGLFDWQLGLLSGLAFALLYTTAGIPLARLADRSDRRVIIAVAMGVWSIMTAASGLATGFVWLVLARVLVGLGEAGGVAPAFSLISDYFPPHRRATAIAIFNLGSPLGILVGLAVGGWLSDTLGWRAAFYIAGGLGAVIAILVYLVVRDPRPPTLATAAESGVTLYEVFRFLWGQPAFRHLALGTALMAFGAYGFLQWIPAFLIRSYGTSVTYAGVALGLIVGIAGALGSIAGGLIGDFLGRRDLRWYLWTPGIAMLIAMPLSVGVYTSSSLSVSLAFIAPTYFLLMIYAGPCFSLTQTLVPPNMRASAAAVLLLVVNLVGLGLGPQTVGILSDLLKPRFGHESLRYALLCSTAFFAWAAVHYAWAARTIRRDVAKAESLASATVSAIAR